MQAHDDLDFLISYTKDLFTTLNENFNQCKVGINVSSVHDSRVSLRRLMALVDVLAYLHPDSKEVLAVDKKALKKLQKRFSATRDLHVSQKYITDNISSKCNTKEYLDFLTGEASKAEKKLANKLNGIKFSSYLKIEDSIIRHASRKPTAVSLPEILYSSLDGAFLITIEKIEKLDSSNLATFHSVRISLKGFRYILEILYLIDKNYKESLDDLKQFQDCLGEIQDLTVLKRSLRNCNPDLKKIFEYDCMIDFIDDRLSLLADRFYIQRYDVLKLWEIKI
jgi:CHAD domain-containing protein